MSATWIRQWGVLLAVLCIGCLLPACGAQSGDAAATGTVNLTSLPAAEVWIDGKAAGTTPVTVALATGSHEVVLKQAGFAEHRETVQVAAGSVRTLDAGLQIVDAGDPDAVRQLASAFGITVEPFRAPEISRGAASDAGIALMFPRNDIRKEGLLSFRVDVTPAYDATGFLEFRKGRQTLLRTKFEPATLVTAAAIPAEVMESLKVGDTVTWGIYYTDSRKPVTAQFEVVNKPAATRKLNEIADDRRLARQPLAVRQQLEAEVLQNYRLYSEALVRLLDMRAADSNNLVPLTGIVTCLRRLDLEDTGLFTDSAIKAVGHVPKGRQRTVAGADVLSGLPTAVAPRLPTLPPVAGTAPSAPAPSAPEASTPPTDTAEGTPPTGDEPGRQPTDPATRRAPADPAGEVRPPDPAAGPPPTAAPGRKPRDGAEVAPPRDPVAGDAPPTDPNAGPAAGTPPVGPGPGTPPEPSPSEPPRDPAAGTQPAPGPVAGPQGQQPPTPKAGPQPSVLPPANSEAMKTMIASATERAKTTRDAAALARAAASEAAAAAQAAPQDQQARAHATALKLAADGALQAAVKAQMALEALKSKSNGAR